MLHRLASHGFVVLSPDLYDRFEPAGLGLDFDRDRARALEDAAKLQLDMIDGTTDGTPPIADAALRARWVEVCTAEFRRLRRGADHVLRPYAATDAGEFFAVATEQFFTQPVPLRDGAPELYDVLRGFYGQDPASRLPG